MRREVKGFALVFFVFIFLVSVGTAVSINSVFLNSTLESNSTLANLTGYVNYSNPTSENFSFIYNWYENGTLNRTTLLEDSLVSYYPFDYDYSDYYSNSDLTPSSSINFSSGVKGNGLIFDGESLTNNTSPEINSFSHNFSVSFWIKTNSTQTYQEVLSVWNSSLNKGYIIKIIGGNWVRLTVSSQPDNITDFRQGSTFTMN